jgi:hypothetical protein
MCDFFSAILTRDGAVRFCEDSSHETILTRLGWPDNGPLETRGWVRVERLWTNTGWRDVCVDEFIIPGWYADDRARYEGLVGDTADRVQPAWAAYKAIEQPAWAAYKAIEQSAWAAYQAIEQPARPAYGAIEQPALAAYEAIEQPALAAYRAIAPPAWAAYLAQIASIEGYVAG